MKRDTRVKNISLDDLVNVWVETGYNNTETARRFNCHKSNVARRLQKAALAGDERIDPAKLVKVNDTSPLAEEIIKAQVELGLRNERKVKKGDWRKPSLISHIGEGPILLGVFGDPHLDNPGADLEEFEDNLSKSDPEQRIFTCCVGDFFDNWPRVMGHLYAETGDPAPAWTMFEYWMSRWPFLFSVSGNHDQFNGSTANFLDVFMRERGSLLKRSGGTFVLPIGGEPIKIGMRHIWRGNSMYSEAHSLKRAAAFGFTDHDVTIGGHIHQGELRTHIRPHDGRVTKLVQISSFKKLDNYANDRGFMSPETPPVVWLVCDGREPVTSHNRVQSFYDFNTARAVLEHQRGKNL